MRAPLLIALMVIGAALPSAAGAQTRNCGWSSEVSGSQVNAAYPDQAATYWTVITPIPPGGYLEARGRFPYARYMSFHAYDVQLSAIDALADVEIAPEPGSVNPFVEGAPRLGDARDYAVRLVGERKPAGTRAPNTIYTENEAGTKSTRGLLGGSLTLRIYEPNRGLDAKGGVPLPELTLVTATGARTVLPECPEARFPDVGAREGAAALGAGIDLPSLAVTARNPPVWRRHLNVRNSSGANLDTPYTPANLYALYDEGTRGGASGGLAENVHNAYVFTTFERTYGAVLAFRMRLPVTPRTLNAEPVMGGGELRYASFCTNLQSTSYLNCRNDDAIPTDADGFATVVVSPAAARPITATEKCGVAWLPTGPAQSVLIVRNMLPAPSFTQSVQLAQPGFEESVLGPHYPRGTYFRTRADAEAALECRPPANPAAGVECVDRLAPVTARPRVRGVRRGRLIVRVSSRDRACGGRVVRVQVAIARRGAGGCRFATRDGRLTGARPCSAPRFLRATPPGRAWRVRVRSRLPRGRYLIRARGVDAVGNVGRAGRTVRLRVR